jgi:hypothetical protein
MNLDLIVVGLCVTVSATQQDGHISALSIIDGVENLAVGVQTERSFNWYDPEDLEPTLTNGFGCGDTIMVVKGGHPLYGEIVVGAELYPFEGVFFASVFHRGKPHRIFFENTTFAEVLSINNITTKVVYEGGGDCWYDKLRVGGRYEVVDRRCFNGRTMYRLGGIFDRWFECSHFKSGW